MIFRAGLIGLGSLPEKGRGPLGERALQPQYRSWQPSRNAGDALFEEQVPVAHHIRARRDGRVQVDQRIAVVVVLGPVRNALAVGVAVLGEVGPVGHHLFAQRAVFRPHVETGARVQRAEDVLDVVRVERKRAQVELAGSGRQLEMVAIDGRVSGLEMSLKPLPGGEGDESVAAEVDGGAQRLRIGVAGIELEEFRRAIAKILFGDSFHCATVIPRMPKKLPSSAFQPASSGM